MLRSAPDRRDGLLRQQRSADAQQSDEIASDGVRFDRALLQRACLRPLPRVDRHRPPPLQARGEESCGTRCPTRRARSPHYFKDHGYVTGARSARCTSSTRRGGTASTTGSIAPDHDKRLTQAEQQAFRDDQYVNYPADGGYATGLSGSASTLPERYFPDTFFAEESVAFLRENKDRPFCLWTSFYMPHTPLVPAKQYWDMYDGITLSLPERSDRELEDGFEGHLIRSRQRGWYDQEDDSLREAIRGYYGNISQTDANVGAGVRHVARAGARQEHGGRLHLGPRRDGRRAPHVDQAQHVRTERERAADRAHAGPDGSRDRPHAAHRAH